VTFRDLDRRLGALERDQPAGRALSPAEYDAMVQRLLREPMPPRHSR